MERAQLRRPVAHRETSRMSSSLTSSRRGATSMRSARGVTSASPRGTGAPANNRCFPSASAVIARDRGFHSSWRQARWFCRHKHALERKGDELIAPNHPLFPKRSLHSIESGQVYTISRPSQRPSVSMTSLAATTPEYCCWPVIRLPSRTACGRKAPCTMKLVSGNLRASVSIRNG